METDHFFEDQIPEDVKLTIFRIVQEQLNNITKYAKANPVTLQLATNKGEVKLSIIDDGTGFDTSQKRNGIGLSNIQNRVELYNRTVNLVSSPGNGCSLQVYIPGKNISVPG